MDVSGDVADLMVKESIQLTEASIKLLAAGSKNLAALLWALAKGQQEAVVGKIPAWTAAPVRARAGRCSISRRATLRSSGPLPEKRSLFWLKDKRRTDGMVDLVTNVDFVSQVNLFHERRGSAHRPERTLRQKKPLPALNPAAPHHNAELARRHRRASGEDDDGGLLTAPAAKIGDIPTGQGNGWPRPARAVRGHEGTGQGPQTANPVSKGHPKHD